MDDQSTIPRAALHSGGWRTVNQSSETCYGGIPMIPISFAIATTPDGLFRRLTIANAAELNHQVMQSEPGCLVVARSEPILEQLKREELLRFDESSIALFPLRGCTETAEDWSDLPAA
ncbi:MAG: hypothetical protein AB7U20_12580, partial [Planctomycetaceae bacterium]